MCRIEVSRKIQLGRISELGNPLILPRWGVYALPARPALYDLTKSDGQRVESTLLYGITRHIAGVLAPRSGKRSINLSHVHNRAPYSGSSFDSGFPRPTVLRRSVRESCCESFGDLRDFSSACLSGIETYFTGWVSDFPRGVRHLILRSFVEHLGIGLDTVVDQELHGHGGVELLGVSHSALGLQLRHAALVLQCLAVLADRGVAGE